MLCPQDRLCVNHHRLEAYATPKRVREFRADAKSQPECVSEGRSVGRVAEPTNLPPANLNPAV